MAKKSVATKRNKTKVAKPATKKQSIKDFFRPLFVNHPHYSFQRTYRRDLPKRAELPGNIMFTAYVLSFMKNNWKTLGIFALVYIALYIFFTGFASQDAYQIVAESLNNLASGESSQDVSAAETLSLLSIAVFGGLNGPQDSVQQMYVSLLAILMWLVLVWFARHRFNGVEVRARDALYNAGAPFIPTIMLTIFMLLQLIPVAIGVIAFATLQTIGLIDLAVAAIIIGIIVILLTVLSLYWISTTFIALITVTVPGTYPVKALRMSGDIVMGRRLQVILRLLWAMVFIGVVWVAILIPSLLIESFLPWQLFFIVPLLVHALSAFSFIFTTIYIYMLYRGLIDEPIRV